MKQSMRFCLYGMGIALACACGMDAASLRPARAGMGFRARVIPVLRADARTGQPIHMILVAPLRRPSSSIASDLVPTAAETMPGSLPAASAVQDLVANAAKAYEVSPELVASVIEVESNNNPNAVSPKGALGLMQLMPSTARRFGVKNAFDPKENIDGGVRYLRFLQDSFKDDRLAIAAYNAGEGAVQKYHNNVPPYRETREYVAKVGKKYDARRAAGKRKAAESKELAVADAPPPPEHRPLVAFVDEQGRLHLATQ